MVRNLLILTLVLLASPVELAAQDMRRCQRVDGSIIYTDRQCDPDQGEKLVETPVAPHPQSGRIAVAAAPACSRTADDLLYDVRNAIDSHDVNLLARSYHWPDLSDSQVESILNRLDTMVQRPLLDLRLLFASPPETQIGVESDSSDSAEISESDQDRFVPAPALPLLPHGLKVLQHASATDSQVIGTTFGLRRHFGCWWIRY